jgi:hypothetical protein
MTSRVSRSRTVLFCQRLALGLALVGCGGEADRENEGTPEAGAGGSDAAGMSSNGDAGAASGGSSDAGGQGGNGPDAGTQTRDGSAGTSDAGGAASDAGPVGIGDGSTSSSERFSFFVTSHAAIIDLAKDPQGFGGDLRYGETGEGAGLRGADRICSEIAERGMPGAGKKQWRAFLSAAAGGADGGPVHARDRIGQGPWYDRKGRLVGNALADLISGDRPSMADAMIRDDLPNETGTGNHAPDGRQIDNHDTLTASDRNGRYVSGANTCLDWTSSSTSTTGTGGAGGAGGSGPSIGHSWPRSATNGRNWISDHRAGGCGKGVNLGGGSTNGTPTVGSGGGYGGFYCFALTP